jgi:hypothetical protein
MTFNFNAHFKVEYPASNFSAASLSGGRGQGVYVCLHCPVKWTNNSREKAMAHLRSKHPRLIQDGQRTQSGPSVAGNSTRRSQYPMSTSANPAADHRALRNVFNAQRYNESTLAMLTKARMPISTLNAMKDLSLAANPAIEGYLITSRRQAINFINNNYARHEGRLRELLQEPRSMIHLSTDLWTSSERLNAVAVSAQWVDQSYRLRKALLGVPETSSRYEGDIHAELIMHVVHRYNISRVGYHVGDNATTNNACGDALATGLKEEHEVR